MYHLFKQSRTYTGRPYKGPTSDNVEASYNTFEEALLAAQEFTERNPVGWNIFEAESGEIMDIVEYTTNPYSTMSQQDIRRELSGIEFWNEDKGDRA